MAFSLFIMLLFCLPYCLVGIGISSIEYARSSTTLCSKTPEDFPEKYISSCLKRGEPMYLCKAAWSVFSGAFAGKDPSTVTQRYPIPPPAESVHDYTVWPFYQHIAWFDIESSV